MKIIRSNDRTLLINREDLGQFVGIEKNKFVNNFYGLGYSCIIIGGSIFARRHFIPKTVKYSKLIAFLTILPASCLLSPLIGFGLNKNLIED